MVHIDWWSGCIPSSQYYNYIRTETSEYGFKVYQLSMFSTINI